jgi:hypothetical protein
MLNNKHKYRKQMFPCYEQTQPKWPMLSGGNIRDQT